jgi:ATP-binding cassette, subfamily B, bacterial PglK
MKQYIKNILALLGDDARKLPWILLAFLGVSVLDIVGIGLIAPYISIIIDPQVAIELASRFFEINEKTINKDTLLEVISYVLLLVFFVKTLLAIWVNYIIVRYSADQQIRLRELLMKSYQSMKYSDYLLRNSSDYIHTTQTLTQQFSNSVLQVGLKAVSDLIVIVAIAILLFVTSPFVFFTLLGVFSLFLIIYDYIFSKKMAILGERANIAASRMIQGIHEGVEGLKENRILGIENFFLSKVVSGAKEYGSSHAISNIISLLPRYVIELIVILFIVIFVLIALSGSQSIDSVLPIFGIFSVAAIRLLPAINSLSNGISQFRFNKDGVHRLLKDIKKSKENTFHSIKRNKANVVAFRDFSMKKVSFKYPNTGVDVISNLDINFSSGQSIGFIGSSGSGKTTLIDIILGLLIPQSGRVMINNNLLVEDNVGLWWDSIAYIPQQVFIIDDTLKQNIALGVEERKIDHERLMESIKMACLSETVSGLSKGVETMLGERGIRLSGGQRQRISLARAFYHKRDVLVMDEATSALDSDTEREIIDEIKMLKGKVTLLIIAHRLTTLQSCDLIYKLENGKIVECGTPKEIIGYH